MEAYWQFFFPIQSWPTESAGYGYVDAINTRQDIEVNDLPIVRSFLITPIIIKIMQELKKKEMVYYFIAPEVT